MITIPVPYQLFGPVQTEGSMRGNIGSEWLTPGAAFTAHTKWLPFNVPTAPVRFARWLVVWTPNRATARTRLVSFDHATDVRNLLEMDVMAELAGQDTMSAIVQAVDITSKLNALVTLSKQRHLAFQVKDDGIHPWRIFEHRIEVSWIIQP